MALEIVVKTTYGATNDKVGIMTARGFQISTLPQVTVHFINTFHILPME